MFLIPMVCWCYCRKLRPKFLIPFWCQFQGKSWLTVFHIIFATTYPKTDEYFALESEGNNVIAKGLVFGNTIE